MKDAKGDEKEGNRVINEKSLTEFVMTMFGTIEKMRDFTLKGEIFCTFKIDKFGKVFLHSVNTKPGDPIDEIDDDEEDEFFYPKEAKLKPYYKNKFKLDYIG